MGILKSKPKVVQTGRTEAAERTTSIRSNVSRSENLSETKTVKVKELRRTVKTNIQSSTSTISEHASRLQLSDDISSRLKEDIPAQRNEETMKEDFSLVIAIDFGTTYSGYGYQFLDEYRSNPMKISFPQAFNGGTHNLLSLKTSTCILINKNRECEDFGYEAEERYEELCLLKKHEQFFFFKHFKMKLQEMKGLEANFLLADETESKELPAMIVFSLAIKCLKEHALQHIKSKRANIDESSILWALTVPAIWNEAATQFMKDAAVKAGMKRENLTIVFEPEAASFACRYLPVQTLNQTTYQPCFSDVPIGTLYMVVDLGGGTADIVIHKKIDQRRVKEISKPSGGPWGGTEVDSNFVKFIIKIVGAKVFMIFKQNCPGSYAEFMQEFEVKKRNVEPTMRRKVHIKLPADLSNICRKETGKDFQETVKETEYNDKIQFAGDKALIDPEIFYGLFEPVAEKIVEHVKNILHTRHGSQVALLLMVGGFSESKFIQKIIKREFQSDTMDVLIPEDPGVSVIKGAIVFAREEKLLAFRVRDVTCVAALHIGRNKTSIAIQFRDKFEADPNKVLGVTFQGRNGVRTMHDSACVLIDQSMNLNCVGNEAEETYEKLCDSSMEKEWHFFKDFYLQLEEQEDNIELILRDQENGQIKAIDILKIYIFHGLNHLENLYRERGVYDLMRETHFVFTAPANWGERDSIRLLSDAAELAGLKEERITIVLESEAINQYCKINKLWRDLDVADAPIGSIVVIANLSETKGELTFHEKKSKGAVTGAYKTVSGPWGTKSLSDGFLHTLTTILGMDLVEQFKREYPTIYNDLCTTIEVRGKSIRLDQENNVNLRFPVKNFDELCRKSFFKSFKECVEDSEYCTKIKVATVKLDINTSLFKGIFSRVTDAIVGHVTEHQMSGGIQRNSFLVLTGGFSDYEMLKILILPKLKILGVKTVLIHSDECPVLKGAIAYGFTCE
ncbi:hypothetical protein CHS0354_029251 [Potamilus streckersoni]|uniref:Heat shock 70 kDa protein 12A n=1 Tax=Potamilus streckersoni TaxID=2493646 RepID=A0AAE0SZV2_9BIVA|nr:hypothetical protein CHS0354_029251 [Potamilus streckersoni]